MKLLTTNFLTCAVKACKSSPASFPLHFRDAVLERAEIPYNPLFMANILPRLNWDALRTTATELGLEEALPSRNPSDGSDRALPPGAEKEEEEKTAAEAEKDDGMEVDDGGKAAITSEGDGDRDGDGDGDGDGGPGGGEREKKEEVMKKLHGLLLETSVAEGKLVCGNCGFEYPIKDGVGNFLLPAHLV